MSAIVKLLGEKLLGKDGTTIETSEIAKENPKEEGVIGLYFSAHWCPPCRSFTPKLGEFYSTLKKTDKGGLFEIVFISSDKDEGAFDDYFKEMPWLALPFDQRDRKGQLSKKFKVKGIPTLVFLNRDTGDLINNKAREIVMQDPKGEGFPWPPKSVQDILAEAPLKSKDGEVSAAEALKDKVIGLYFSAHWCPPCRGFTPKLVETYNNLKEDGKNFEIIFVSSDRSEQHFSEYFAEMPWLSVPYGDKRVSELSSHFDISGIPTLVILDQNYDTVNKHGRQVIMKDPTGKDFPWLKKALNPLDSNQANDINDTPVLIYFTEGDADEIKRAKDVLLPTAEEYTTAYKKSQQQQKGAAKGGASVTEELKELLFMYETDEDEDIAESLLNFLKLPEKYPLLILLDIPEKRLYEFTGEITKEAVEHIVKKFKKEELEFKPIQQ